MSNSKTDMGFSVPNSKPNLSAKLSFSKLLTLFILIIGAIAVLSPLIVVFQTSFTSGDRFTLDNYKTAWHQGNFLLAFANSTLVALSVTALQIFTSTLAGYALARLKFKGKQAILLLILTTLVIPFQLLVIPTFIVLKWAHLINSYWSLILPTAANGFGIFLMRQYFAGIPVELEEAGTSFGWQKYVGFEGGSVSIERFGASAPGAVCLEKFGFSVDNVVAKAKEVIG